MYKKNKGEIQLILLFIFSLLIGSVLIPKETKQVNDKIINPTVNNTKITTATVQKTGLDFYYESNGEAQVNNNNIVVNYDVKKPCNNSITENVSHQKWEITFDIASSTWTDRVKEISNCGYKSNQEWVKWSSYPSQFTIQTENNETIIKADAQDYDKSLIIENNYIVKYTKNN